ncbi:helix-turn-helix transcriptional regulator [Vibrio parahaemolyticus]|nr:helix-turn-helix transcriptional regulator [Vibrio parahaemolyticus]MDN4710935.1 helix-turn-helix transcriptional regulator [Vibrio parahaemolyticus]
MQSEVGTASIVVGKKLRRLERKKLTIEDLASKSGLSVAHLSRLENGRKSPTITTLEKIALALDVPIVYFFSVL